MTDEDWGAVVWILAAFGIVIVFAAILAHCGATCVDAVASAIGAGV